MVDFHTQSIYTLVNDYAVEFKQAMIDWPGPAHQFHSSHHIPQWVNQDFTTLPYKPRAFCNATTPIEFDATQGVGTNEEAFAESRTVEHGFCSQNTSYARYLAPRVSKCDAWMHDIAINSLHLSQYKIKVNLQPTGQFFPAHFDAMITWCRENPEHATQRRFTDVKRYILFITPQECGHFFSTASGAINWEAGDCYSMSWHALHATGNASPHPKILVQFEGFETYID